MLIRKIGLKYEVKHILLRFIDILAFVSMFGRLPSQLLKRDRKLIHNVSF